VGSILKPPYPLRSNARRIPIVKNFLGRAHSSTSPIRKKANGGGESGAGKYLLSSFVPFVLIPRHSHKGKNWYIFPSHDETTEEIKRCAGGIIAS